MLGRHNLFGEVLGDEWMHFTRLEVFIDWHVLVISHTHPKVTMTSYWHLLLIYSHVTTPRLLLASEGLLFSQCYIPVLSLSTQEKRITIYHGDKKTTYLFSMFRKPWGCHPYFHLPSIVCNSRSYQFDFPCASMLYIML